MERRALLVGVNRYKLPGHDLQGCVTDVKRVYELLKAQAFRPEYITVLTDERATAERIRKGLQWLCSGPRGSLLVFYFSGHGSQVKDLDGDEPDKLDEILCPHDLDWNGTWICDDEIAALAKELPPQSTWEMIVDACHSGTVHRSWHLTYRREKFIPPPWEMTKETGYQKKSSFREDRNVICWAACSDEEVAYETRIGGSPCGLFTYHLEQEVRRGPNLSRSLILARVSQRIRCSGFKQHPQLSCTRAEAQRPWFT